jgi:GxxExxY protein
MSRGKLIEDQLTGSIIESFYEVYRELGYGFLEHVHCSGLEREFARRKIACVRELGARIYYKGEDLCTCRLDMVVEDKVIIEVKSTEKLPPTSLRQLQNYLRSTDYEVGLLLHFGADPKFYRRILTNDNKKRNPRTPFRS